MLVGGNRPLLSLYPFSPPGKGKMNLPEPELYYRCQNPDCDPGFSEEALFTDKELFWWDGKPRSDWTEDGSVARSQIDHGPGFYCRGCLFFLGVPFDEAKPLLFEALEREKR